ncbi:hypothetical protein SLEP1_g7646 [Rubroshorea leprosula]|uniref:Uncharacterized protein n=1 Tax=Rubroshorea leprosula TaxID=152421 RepID=A0AAV5I918_9ROSI|nr:hypothetical protein SLEP1_g7646 [Rubroshorea leprosula]
MAASRRALNRFSSFMLLLMVVFMPIVHTSRTGFPGGRRAVAEQRVTVAQELERNLSMEGSFGNGGANFSVEQREVPTGPDPLHHNNNPTGP